MEVFWDFNSFSWHIARCGVCILYEKTMSEIVQRALTGFAAGVMVAASVWSLLIPAIEQSTDMGKFSFVPAAIGFGLAYYFALT